MNVLPSRCQTLETLERVPERLSARHHRVNAQPPTGGTEQFEHVVFDNVAPERDEGGRAVVDDGDSVFGEKSLHQDIETARVNPPVVHERQVLGTQLRVLRESLVHRVGIEAVDFRAAMSEVLGEDAGDQTLSDATLPLQREGELLE